MADPLNMPVPERIEAARLRNPLPRLMGEHGYQPPETGRGKQRCPFCGDKTAQLDLVDGRHWFKCWHPKCRSGTAGPKGAWDEIGFLMFAANTSNPKEGMRLFLQQSGLWVEERLGPGTLPGSRPRKSALEKAVFAAPTPPTVLDDAPVADANGPDDGGAEPAPAADEFSQPVPGAGPESTSAAAEPPPLAASASVPPGPVGESSPTPNGPPEEAGGGVSSSSGSPAAGGRRAGWVEPLEDDVRAALRWFYGRLSWTAEDMRRTWQKRRLAPQTQRVFGLRSNRPENLALLQAMAAEFEIEVLLRAGLWERAWSANVVPAQFAKRFPAGFVPEIVEGAHPARHFFGYGFVGKRRNPRTGEKEAAYEWCQPPLIPYFDWLPEGVAERHGFVGITEGEFKAMAWWQALARNVERLPDPPVDKLVGLRPHKHWATGLTPHAFTTPPGGGSLRWQGREVAFGVAALPGISFAKKQGRTWLTRHGLDEFLELGGAEFVQVIYDNEDKGTPGRAGYQPDVRDRFDPVVWGLFLARDLAGRYRTSFAMLPDNWRNAEGKADWDGALSLAGGLPEPDWLARRAGPAGAAATEPEPEAEAPGGQAGDEVSAEEMAALFPD